MHYFDLNEFNLDYNQGRGVVGESRMVNVQLQSTFLFPDQCLREDQDQHLYEYRRTDS